MDLSTWSEEGYFVSLGRRLIIRAGGKRYRCEYCRLNFVSFRPRREKFVRRNRRSNGAGNRPGSGCEETVGRS